MSDSKVSSQTPSDPEISSGSPTEVELAILQARTRRHFLRSIGGGLGTLFLGTLASRLVTPAQAAGAETAALDFSRDPELLFLLFPRSFQRKYVA